MLMSGWSSGRDNTFFNEHVMRFIHTLLFYDAPHWPAHAPYILPSVGLSFITLIMHNLLPAQWIKGPLEKYGSKAISGTLLALVRGDWEPPRDWMVHVVVAFCKDHSVRSALVGHLHELVLNGWEYIKRSGRDDRYFHPRQCIAMMSS